MVARRSLTSGGRTIRVSNEMYLRLSEISRREQLPIGEVVANLVREREDREFFARLNEAALRLRADETAWKEFEDELNDWDATLLDGLEDGT